VNSHSNFGKWEQLSFDEAVEPISDEGKRVDQRDYEPTGALPVIDQGESLIGGYTNDLSKSYTGPLPIVVFGDHTRRVKLVNEPFAVGAQGVKLLRPREGWSVKFFAYLLSTLPIPDRGYSRHYQFVRKLTFPRPRIDEQERVVAEIEKQFTRLDAGVASLKRVQTALKRYRASVLKAACEGRLVSTEAQLARKENRTYETGEQLLQHILKERREWFDRKQSGTKTKRKYIEPAPPEISKLPLLPEGWTWGTWNQLSNWVTYGFTRPMPHVEHGIPIITARGVNRGRIDFDGAHLTTREAYSNLSEKDRPQLDDILITKDGTIGRAAIVDTDREFCINQSVAVVWLRSSAMNRRFLLAVIESELTQKPIWAKARGVAIQHLSITDFAKMSVPIPPLAEQQRIVADVDRCISVVEELDRVISTGGQRAERLRQAVLRGAFAL
jgi:type I restriction enzyme S subunit